MPSDLQNRLQDFLTQSNLASDWAFARPTLFLLLGGILVGGLLIGLLAFSIKKDLTQFAFGLHTLTVSAFVAFFDIIGVALIALALAVCGADALFATTVAARKSNDIVDVLSRSETKIIAISFENNKLTATVGYPDLSQDVSITVLGQTQRVPKLVASAKEVTLDERTLNFLDEQGVSLARVALAKK